MLHSGQFPLVLRSGIVLSAADVIRRSPTDPDKQVVKRIIALEGDRVYTRAPYPVPIVDVPPGHVWVEGDGGRQSIDSNTYGPITKSLIIGKITHVLLPWSSSGQIHWEHFRGKTRIIRGPLP